MWPVPIATSSIKRHIGVYSIGQDIQGKLRCPNEKKKNRLVLKKRALPIKKHILYTNAGKQLS
jgi:hypothetical protein